MNRIPRSIAALACAALLLVAPAAWAAPGAAEGAPSAQLEPSGPSWVDLALRALSRLWPSAAPAAPEAVRAPDGTGSDGSLDSGPIASGGPMCDPLKAEIGCSNDPNG